MNNIISVGGIAYLPEAKAIVAMTPSADLYTEPDTTIDVGKYKKIVPWGDDNMWPQKVIENAKKCEVLGSNLEFNVQAGYGQGIRPARRIMDRGKIIGYEEILSGEVFDWCEDNDLTGYFLEQLTDLKIFYNPFPEIIVSNDGKKITNIRSKEATFSRWGTINPKLGRIDRHFYSAKWGDNPSENDVDFTDVIDRFYMLDSLNEYISKKKRRFIVPINFPTPGRSYYQWASWWSIFFSGWFDYALMIPAFKKALLKNGLGVKFIIYISPKYFANIFRSEGIDPNDQEVTQARIAQEHQNWQDFLTNAENAGKGIVAIKEMIASAGGAIEEKHIEIVTIPLKMSGGELNEDSSEVSSIISYAMGVDLEMPGKNSGSMSGTDKRERFMIRQALMKPFRDRLLRPLTLVKRFNKWSDDTVFIVPDIEFTTLDQNKSGKQETTKT